MEERMLVLSSENLQGTITEYTTILAMKKIPTGIIALVLAAGSCHNAEEKSSETESYTDVKIAGAMHNVMWKGQLGSSIDVDTISDKSGLYGLGPESYLTGEILINNGKSYVSRVLTDSTMMVEETHKVSAPFLVYANVSEWREVALPQEIKSITELEKFIDQKTKDNKRPFAFNLKGKVAAATIHIQNLPKGSKVSSPKEAHHGQTSYHLQNKECEIVGFFSTKHQGIFTHHDSFVHLHLITKDESMMGHLDELQIEKMSLYLPVK